MNNFKIGAWTYKKSNNTLNFYVRKVYSYEIDLDKKDITSNMWIKHLLESKSEKLISFEHIQQLIKCFDKLNLNLDHDQAEKDIIFYNQMREENADQRNL